MGLAIAANPKGSSATCINPGTSLGTSNSDRLHDPTLPTSPACFPWTSTRCRPDKSRPHPLRYSRPTRPHARSHTAMLLRLLACALLLPLTLADPQVPAAPAPAAPAAPAAAPAAAPGAAAPAAPAAPAAAGPDAKAPYTMQTGAIRYAPMQAAPPTAIVQQDMKPLFPTSAFTVSQSYWATPVAQTTITTSRTVSLNTKENEVRDGGRARSGAVARALRGVIVLEGLR